MRLLLTRDPEQFAGRAEGFLAERVERNVLATVFLHARRGRFDGETPLFACGLGEDGGVRAAALRIPPWPLLASDFEATAADELIELWIAEDPQLPGVGGQPVTARALAAAWSRQTGRQTKRRMREAMHALTEVVDPPRPGRGRLRLAGDSDRDLLIEWEQALVIEAGLAVDSEAEQTVARRMAYGGQFIWDDDGAVAMLGLSPAIAGTVRVGPVYTPPERRRRGYAGSAVAAASRRALAEGARRCMLFTDLANSTSNKIYATVGYRRFGDWEEYAFVEPHPGAGSRARR